MEKFDRIKEIFQKAAYGDNDWSLAADKFVQWTVAKGFNTESFRNFVEWIPAWQIEDVWNFFFGYGEDFARFAEDWVDETERSEYLAYCLGE